MQRGKTVSTVLAVVVAIAVLVLDQVSKYLIINNFTLTQSVPVIPGVIHFTYIHNTGAAFGILKDQSWILLGVTIAVMIVCVGAVFKNLYKSQLVHWAIMLVLSGGIGNMIDRVFRHGNVVDFIEFAFIRFPVFNVADIAVCVGVGILILYFILDTFKRPKLADIPTSEKPEK